MSQYTQGLAYQLDPRTFKNAAFPQLPESTPTSYSNVSYDSGSGAVISSSSGGINYNSTFGINPNDFAVYFTLKLTSGGSPGTQILSASRVLGFVNSSGTTVGQVGIGTWFTSQPYTGPDSIEYYAPTTMINLPGTMATCNYHWKFSTPFTQASYSTIYDGSPIWDTTVSYLVQFQANTTNGLKLYAGGSLRSMGNSGSFGGGTTPLTALKVFHFIQNLSNSGNIYLSALNIFSTASQMDYSSMVTTTPSPGILPTSFTSGISKLRKYFINSGVPIPSPNVNLSGIEARFDQHRFYYPRPNKISFTLRGGSNG